MNNYQNPNGQFGGWGQNNIPYGANYAQNNGYSPYYNEQYLKQQEKKKDKKILRKMGNRFGLAIIAYVFLSLVMSLMISLLSEIIPRLNLIYEDSIASFAYTVLGSVFYIGVPFGVVYLTLKSGKLTGNLPFGTVYNRKAAVFLTMFMVPIMLISSMVVNAISLVIQSLIGVEFTSGLEDLQMNGVGGVLMGIVSMAIVPAIIEEFAVRGVVMQPLRRYGDGFAIVASAFIFSIMHGNMAQIPYTVVGGVYLGYLTIATGSIWPSIILHFINNLYSVIIMAVDSNFGENSSYIAVVIMMVMFVISGIVGGIGFFSMNYKTKLAKGVESLKAGDKISSLFGNVPMVIAIIIMVVITLTSIES